jgi:hypothetical protein
LLRGAPDLAVRVATGLLLNGFFLYLADLQLVSDFMRIISINLNGIRAAAAKGFYSRSSN